MWMWWWKQVVRTTDISNRHEPEPACAGDAHVHQPAAEPCTAVGPAESGAGQCAGPAPQRCRPPASLNEMDTDLQRLADACNRAAEHYCEHQPTQETVVDIYRAMAALASMLDSKVKTAPILQRKLH